MMVGQGLPVCLLVVSYVLVQSSNAQRISGDSLSRELNKVVDDVGLSVIQEEYNKLKYQETRTDGKKLVQEIANKISERLGEVDSALKSLKEAVEKDKLSSAEAPQDCCMDGVYQENLRFRANVSLEMFCYSKPSYVFDKKKYISNAVKEEMKSNVNKKSLMFQYIALKSGVYFNYPATKLTDCESYDPRFRPFYVSSTTSIPRDVVVVMEMSASMRGNKLVQAKHAALTVMETLSIQDRFGIVLFNKEAKTLDGCYGDQLVPVTQTTKDSLEKFLTSGEGEHGANYAVAVRKAFTYFKTASGGDTREQILLFVCDGTNDGSNPLEVIRDENQQLNNRVVINTYGIGIGLGGDDKELLKNMSDQALNNNSYGYVKRGKFLYLPDLAVTSLREAMGTYYDESSIPISDTPKYTMPYKDFFTNESIITGCLPLAFYGTFEGVVCADVLLSELVSEILYLKQGEFSYAFIMDGEERTLVHPRIPDPRDVIAKEQDILNIYNFETSGDVHEVIQSMKMGFKGFKSLDTNIMKTRGGKYFEGDFHQNIKAAYHWTPIVAPGSNLSVCLVMEINNTDTSITDQPPPSPTDFLYHRWDLDVWPGPFCRHFSRYATQAKSTVKLTPDAFEEPYLYTAVKETQVRVQQYKDFLSGKLVTNPGLKASAIKSIRLTYPIEEHWRTDSRRDAPYVVWRYVTTEDGVVRVYPGVRLTDDYDHKLRAWYHRTLAHKHVNVLSAPYEDAWGSGKVISLTRVITRGYSRKTEGVLGTDFSIYYFDQMLKNIYPRCADKTIYSCIVIDDSGFLVMHRFYIETTSPITTQMHITYKEGRISRSLISKGIMYRQPCRDTENKKEQFTYRVSLPQKYLGGLNDSAVGYEIRPVTGSNVFLILKTMSLSPNEEKCCSEEVSTSPSSIKCANDQCTCLCYKDLLFNECKNKYNSTDGIYPCNPQLPTLKTVSTPEKDKIEYLKTCFPTNCECRKSESDCFKTSGCSWCKSDVRGDLVDGFCDLKEVCPSQRCIENGKVVCQDCKAKCCGSECDTPSSPPSSSLYVGVGSGVGAVVVLIIVIIIVIAIVRRRPKGGDDTYLDAIHNNPSFQNSPAEFLDYSKAPNYYISQLSATSEESLNTNASI